MEDRSTEFIESFNRIEEYVKRKASVREEDSFIKAVEKLNEEGFFYVQKNYGIFKQLAFIRNAISHQKGKIIYATPNDLSLNIIKKVETHLMKPKKLIDLINLKPITINNTDKLIRVLDTIKQKNISQFPVLDNGKYVGLLTTNILSIWISNQIDRDDNIILSMTNSTVKDALSLAEELDSAKFIDKDIDVNEFAKKLEKNRKTSIWIMTKDGTSNSKIMRLITPYDYQKIHDSII